MTWIHAVKRQGVIAVLSIGLAIPAVGLAGAALADSQGHSASAGKSASAGAGSQGVAASKGKSASNGKSESESAGNGSSNGSSESASAGAASSSQDNSNAAASASNSSNSTSVDSPAGCPNSFHNSDSGNGANVSGAYDSTCNGSASQNGNGNGNATGKPCAGCVGNADDKNPPGQAPDGSDHNKGYECDGNHGVGKTNPAHTGCTPGSTVDKCPDGSAMTDRNGDGKVNGADCNTDHGNPCPATASAAADHGNGNNGNGNANGKDNGNNGQDKGNNGKANGKDKGQGNNGNGNGNNGNGNNGKGNDGKDCGTPGHKDTCPDGSAMTDRNHDGKVNGKDCKDDEIDIPVIHNGNPPQVLGLEITAPGAGATAAAVKPASASLPFTGSNAINMALIADLILLAGTLAIWASGYRRQGHGIQH